MSGRSSATEPCTLTVTMNTSVRGMGIQTPPVPRVLMSLCKVEAFVYVLGAFLRII